MRTTISRILCPVDFSEHSRHALEQAAAIARSHDASVIAMHAFAVAPVTAAVPVGAPLVPEPARITGAMRAALEEDLQEFVSPLRGVGVPIDTEVAGGDPVEAILREAGRQHADLIVIGTHGRTGLSRLTLGSVAESVLRNAPCPVLTVPPLADVSTSLSFARILCAIDFSVCSTRALEYAFAFAPKAEIIAAHAVHLVSAVGTPQPIRDETIKDTPEVRARFTEMALEHLHAAIPEAIRATGRVREVIAIGRPADEMVRIARAERCDLIVLGVERRTVAGRLLFGSTTDRVLREALCPVLTVLQRDEE